MSYPVITTGIVQAPRGAGLMLAAMICGRVVGKVNPRYLVGAGFVTGAYALYRMTFWTPDIAEWDLISAGFIQGISIGFLAIPINIISFATLPSELRTEATGIYSLVRNLGSAIGISITASLLEINTQVNHEMIAADASPFNRALQSGLASRFWSLHNLHGVALLDNEITRQAKIIAFVDDFKLMLVLAVVALPLLLLTRPSASGLRPSPARSSGR
jgi:DHA2 family multidrug resistance protein